MVMTPIQKLSPALAMDDRGILPVMSKDNEHGMFVRYSDYARLNSDLALKDIQLRKAAQQNADLDAQLSAARKNATPSLEATALRDECLQALANALRSQIVEHDKNAKMFIGHISTYDQAIRAGAVAIGLHQALETIQFISGISPDPVEDEEDGD